MASSVSMDSESRGECVAVQLVAGLRYDILLAICGDTAV